MTLEELKSLRIGSQIRLDYPLGIPYGEGIVSTQPIQRGEYFAFRAVFYSRGKCFACETSPGYDTWVLLKS